MCKAHDAPAKRLAGRSRGLAILKGIQNGHKTTPQCRIRMHTPAARAIVPAIYGSFIAQKRTLFNAYIHDETAITHRRPHCRRR